MGTFFSILGVIAFFIIMKFIYDSYLSDNTEKNWQNYEKNNPEKAKIIEQNEGLDFNTNHKIHKNGIYVSHLKGVNADGNHYSLCLFLLFTNDNYVYKLEDEGEPEIDRSKISDAIIGIKQSPDAIELRAEYNYHEGNLNFQHFDDDSRKRGTEYKGIVTRNGMTLDLIKHGFDYDLGKFNSKIIMKNIKFDFISET